MKKYLSLFIAAAMLALALPVSAEYVPCLTESEQHEFTEWRVAAQNDNGTVAVERDCTKCGYVQKGVAADEQGANDGTAAVATTMSLEVDIPMTVSLNPSTGARV